MGKQAQVSFLLEATQPYRSAGWQGRTLPPPGTSEEDEIFCRHIVQVFEDNGVIVVDVESGDTAAGQQWKFIGYAPATRSKVELRGTKLFVGTAVWQAARDQRPEDPAVLAEIKRWIASEKGLV
jgi:hypothetical protein